jgi:peroxiredoxin
MTADRPMAPELQVQRWFNAPGPLTLESLRGKVVVLHAFQMLCPGCVSHAIPQARRLHEFAKGSDLVVLGLHTVFEHHAAMTPVSLEAFLHEYRIAFPVGVDQPGERDMPRTMETYRMRGSPPPW